jgi:hypothetical protein
MVVAEFFLIAFVVGIMTKTWAASVATFFVLYALYRYTRLSAVLSLVLSLYWGLLGFHLGVAVGGIAIAPLFAVGAFVLGLGVHRAGLHEIMARPRTSEPDPVADEPADVQQSSQYAPRPLRGMPPGEIIDAEYRVIS